MAGKRTAPKKPKQDPYLAFEDGYWWIIDGTKRENVGRSRRYAEKLLAEANA
jgi:hypothetical protein